MKKYLLLSFVVLLIISCKKTEDEDLSKPKMSAIVNGKSWTTDYSRFQMVPRWGDSVLLIYGRHANGTVIQIQVNRPPLQAGVYNFDTNYISGINVSYFTNDTVPVTDRGIEGQLTIQRVEPDVIKGVFNFKTSDMTVSQGQFIAR